MELVYYLFDQSWLLSAFQAAKYFIIRWKPRIRTRTGAKNDIWQIELISLTQCDVIIFELFMFIRNTVPGIRIWFFVHRKLEKIFVAKKKTSKAKKQLKQQRAKLSAVSSPCPCQMNITWRKTRNAHISFGSRTLTLYSIHCETFESELFFFSFRIRNFPKGKNGGKTQTIAKKIEYIHQRICYTVTRPKMFASHIISLPA